MWTIKRFPAPWILPALIPVAFLTIFPIAHALWTSLHQVMLLFPGEDWVGLDNYRNVVTDEYFGVALRNSLLFTVLSAPLVVAKGKNYLAQRIRQRAVEHQVPIIENAPLAQALYHSVEVGQEIPPHLYRAVAEILAYIFKLMNGRLPG